MQIKLCRFTIQLVEHLVQFLNHWFIQPNSFKRKSHTDLFVEGKRLVRALSKKSTSLHSFPRREWSIRILPCTYIFLISTTLTNGAPQVGGGIGPLELVGSWIGYEF